MPASKESEEKQDKQESSSKEAAKAAKETEELKDTEGRTREEIDEEARKGLQRGLDAEKERDKTRAEFAEQGYEVKATPQNP
jgi:hypothetical protein